MNFYRKKEEREMENTMLRDLGEYIEQLVNGQVAPEIVEHE